MATRSEVAYVSALIAGLLLSSQANVGLTQNGPFCGESAAQSCPADICPVAMVQYATAPRKFAPKDVPGVSRVRRLSLPNTYALAVPRDVLTSPERQKALREALSRFGTVSWFEPSWKWSARTEPNDEFYEHGPSGPASDGQWALVEPAQVGAPAAFERITGKNRNETHVAVLDTGVRYRHPDLVAQMWSGSPKHGANFAGWTTSTDPNDADGHGTKVAGVIAAMSNNQKGVASLAWKGNTRLIAVKVMDDSSGGCTDRLIDAIDYAVDPARDAKILNLSASSCACSEFLGQKLKSLEESRPDVLLVTAIHEGHPPLDIDSAPDFPASYRFKNILAVQASDQTRLLATFSDFGKKSVHIAAPGAHILTTTLARFGDYEFADGTSFAAPLVSAAAALMKSLAPQWGYSEIRTYLMDSAVKSCSPPEADPRTLCGKNASDGRLNVDRATGPPIEITAPVAGTVWTHGVSQHVSWKPLFLSTLCTTVDVRLSTNGRTFSGAPVASGVRVSDGGVDITPASAAPTARIRVQCENTELDRLSATFSIG